MSTSKTGLSGVIVGIVHDLDDPEKLGRIRLTYPLMGDKISDWARIVTPMAGNNQGFYWRPEVGDEVLVIFEMGDPNRPYILGGIWSAARKPPADDGQHEQNNWRFLKSRSGHLVKLDDTAGKERIEIVDKDNKRSIVLDCKKGQILIESKEGDIDVKSSQGKVNVTATTIAIKATDSINIEANGVLTLKGATVNIN